MTGKALGNIKCKFGCEGGHRTTICTKFQRPREIPQPKPLQITGPKAKKGKRAARAS